jgi:hypothetical protein
MTCNGLYSRKYIEVPMPVASKIPKKVPPEEILWAEVYNLAKNKGLSPQASRKLADVSLIRGKKIVANLRSTRTAE